MSASVQYRILKKIEKKKSEHEWNPSTIVSCVIVTRQIFITVFEASHRKFGWLIESYNEKLTIICMNIEQFREQLNWANGTYGID